VHFGLKDVGELPSLKEFEELAKQALGSEWAAEAGPQPEAAEASAPPASGSTPQDDGVAEESESEVSPPSLPEVEDQG